jgi:Ni/Co efflux regulator RcnB
MKRLLSCAAMLAMILLAGHAQATAPVKKKSAQKQGASKKTTSTKKPAPSTAKRASAAKKGTSTASTRGKNPPVKKTTWRNRQSTPSPERYREIQAALATRGYLKPEEATGTWNAASGDALKKFQSEQNLESKGKINSLSLIALGLGPHREPAATPPPPPKPPQQANPGQ